MALIKEKESLHLKLEKIDAALESLEAGTGLVSRRGRKPGRKPGALKPGPKPGKVRRRGKRLKEPLLKILKAAGAAGITVKEISAQLKVKPGNVFSWFYTTGKKIKGIKKVGEARYALLADK
jgi:hypothetical protein